MRFGLLAVILIRTVLFKPVFLQDQDILLNRLLLNCKHCFVGSISVKDFTLPAEIWRENWANMDYWP